MESRPTSVVFFCFAFTVASVISSTASKSATRPPSVKPANQCPAWFTPLPEPSRPVQKRLARPTVFFTDGTNFDDIVTLLFLCKTPKLDPIAIYIGANGWASAAPSLQIMFDLLHMFSDRYRHVPIFLGSYVALQDEREAAENGRPLSPVPRYRASVPLGLDGILHSDSGFGTRTFLPTGPNHFNASITPETDEQSIRALSQLLTPYKNESVLFLSTGTLTPIAKMFSDGRRNLTKTKILPKMSELVIMGGDVYGTGNLFSLPVNKHAEFNIYNDPHAADEAMRGLAMNGKRTVMVPLDATKEVPLTEKFYNALVSRPSTVEAQFAGIVMDAVRTHWFDPEAFFKTAFLWDPTAAVVAAHPEVVVSRNVTKIRVVKEQGPYGPQQGWTKPCTKHEIAEKLCYNVDVVYNVTGARVEQKLLDALQAHVNSAQRGLSCPIGST